MLVLVLAALASLLVLFGVGTLLFQAGCALADVPERGYFRSLPIYSVAVAVCLPAATALVWFAGRYDADPSSVFGPARGAALAVALLLSWPLSAVLYALFLAASIKKGLVIAGVELLLLGLLAALLSGVVLLILAFVQIAGRTPTTRAVLMPPSIVRAAVSGAR